MASSLNKVELIGRLGKDPEIKNLSNGSAVANFSVATSESWKDKRSGEKVEKTEWHNIVVWNEKTIEFVEKYLGKGDLVRIEGKLQTRSWEDQEGAKKYATEVVIPAFAPVEALIKLSFDNDNNRGGGNRGDDRGSSRSGRSSSRDRDDDHGSNRASGRSSNRDRDDRGGDDRGSNRSRGRDDDRRSDDRDPPRRSAGRVASNDDLDDEIPF